MDAVGAVRGDDPGQRRRRPELPRRVLGEHRRHPTDEAQKEDEEDEEKEKEKEKESDARERKGRGGEDTDEPDDARDAEEPNRSVTTRRVG